MILDQENYYIFSRDRSGEIDHECAHNNNNNVYVQNKSKKQCTNSCSKKRYILIIESHNK